MTFPIYFYIALLVLSPWPLCFSLIFYYRYKFDTTFEYYISRPKDLHELWIKVLFLPIMISLIFMLRYRRIGISLDLCKIRDVLWEIIYPLYASDIVIFTIFLLLFIITWLLGLRVLYQYFRKCILALYIYYYQYEEFRSYCRALLYFKVDYHYYLWNRVEIFTSNMKVFAVTRFIWPLSLDIIEGTLFRFILPYLLIFDSIIHHGVLTKIFIILPWYYIYSLTRFGLKFFFSIHKLENWDISDKMYGYKF